MHNELSLNEIKKEYHGTFESYMIGFIGSIIMTATSFLLAITKVLSGETLVFVLIALAIFQALFQLRFFLHLGQEAKPRWESLVFYFMVLILLIVVVGSLWIMSDLNDRMMDDMTQEMMHD